MVFTYLNQKEKIRSLLYVANNELSSNIDIQNKQYEILKFFWNNYIKQCDYFPFARQIDTDEGIVYTLVWHSAGKKLTIERCEELKREVEARNKKYKNNLLAMTEELAKVNPSWEQLKFIKGYINYLPNWMVHDPEDYVKMFHDKYYLKMLIKTCEGFDSYY